MDDDVGRREAAHHVLTPVTGNIRILPGWTDLDGRHRLHPTQRTARHAPAFRAGCAPATGRRFGV